MGIFASVAASTVGSAVCIGITALLLFVFNAVLSYAIGPITSLALNLTLTPLSVPLVNQIILWSQICALALVIFFRVGKGIVENVFQKAANNNDASLVQWTFKTVISISCVALMPLLCNFIISFGNTAFNNLAQTSNSFISSSGINLSFAFPDDDWWSSLYQMPIESLAMYAVGGLLLFAEIVFILSIVYEIVKRQIICLIVSIAATWVSIKSATDNTDDVIDVLVSLFAITLIQVVQYGFFVIAIYNLQTTGSGGNFIGVDLTDPQTLYSVIFVLALLGAAKGVPTILERYAFATGRGGVGNMVVGAAIRKGVPSARGIGNAVSRGFSHNLETRIGK